MFDLNKINSKIASIKLTKEVPVLVKNKERDVGTSDVPDINNIQISERHTDVIAYALRELWVICFTQEDYAKVLVYCRYSVI